MVELDGPSIAIKRLTLFRRILGKSQNDFATLMGVSRRTYQRIESGETPLTIDWVIQLSAELGIAPAIFLVSQEAIDLYFETHQKFLNNGSSLNHTIKNSEKKLSIDRNLKKDQLISQFLKIFLFFKNGEGKNEDFHISTNTYDKAKLNNSLAQELNIPSGVVHFGEVEIDIAKFMASWERLFVAKSYSRYLVADNYFQYGVNGSAKRSLVLFYLEKMEWNNPKVMGGHLHIPHDALLSEDDMEHICKKLSDIVGEKVLPIKGFN